MAICRYKTNDGAVEHAIYQDGRVCPLRVLGVDLADDADVTQLGKQWFRDLPVPQDDQWVNAPDRLLPPVRNPQKVICIGLNYRDHAIETGSEIPTEPVVFNKFHSTIVGSGDNIVLPRVSNEVDYEAELVVVIGKTAKHVSAVDAMDYVLGYTCGHDVSARDWQKGRPGGQWLLGKTFDTFAPIGPCLVTTDELTDPSDVRVQMHLNGETVQDSTTAQLIFDIPTLIEHLTQIVTLEPGDLIFTGTPPGVGAAMNPPRFLSEGDLCTVEIAGIGRLSNRCQAE